MISTSCFLFYTYTIFEHIICTLYFRYHYNTSIYSSNNHNTNKKIKPDGVQRGIVGNIVSRFETKGYKLSAMKTKQATAELLNEHYCDLADKPFFPKLREYMMSGPVVCMVWEGKEAVTTGRKMLGATNPLASGKSALVLFYHVHAAVQYKG